MPGDIPVPPMPPQGALVAVGAVCIVVGLALLVRGWANGRAILALAAAGAAAAAAPVILRRVPQLRNVWLTAAAAGVTAGLVAFVLGRLLWGGVLGAVLGLAALAVAVWLVGGAAGAGFHPGPIADFSEWCGHMADYLGYWGEEIWASQQAGVALAAGLAALGVALGLLLPRLSLILASGVVGSVAVVAGAGMLLWASRAEWANPWRRGMIVPAAVAAGSLAVIGLAFQSWRQWARGRKAETEPGGGASGGKPREGGGS